MNWLDHKQALNEDLRRWNGKKHLWLYFMKPEYKLIWRYRWCRFFKSHSAMKPLYMFERVLYHHSCQKCGCDIPSSVTIGSGFQLLHSWGTVINSHAVLGQNCTVIAGTMIGKETSGVPKIGNNVYFGAHSIVIGGIEVGNDVKIGAGAVVTKDVPDGAVMVGEKAKNIAK